MRYEEVEVASVGDILARLREQAPIKATVWFRGQARESWSLDPTLLRPDYKHLNELALMKRFIQLAIPHMTDPIPAADAEWDWVFLMQHHALPTRLLDWTENPLAAVWFALNSGNAEDEKEPAALWCLDPLALNNASNLRGRWQSELPAFGRDKVLDSYLPEQQQDGAAVNPAAAIASRKFRRIVAQQGNFTINHTASPPIINLGDQTHVWRLIIPASAKKGISEELAYLRFNVLQLFPDLDRAAAVAMESF